MARRKKKKQEISLFPFLDILACVIGNLILIITAVVLESVDTDKLADLFQNEAIQKQTEENLAREKQDLVLMLGRAVTRNTTVTCAQWSSSPKPTTE